MDTNKVARNAKYGTFLLNQKADDPMTPTRLKQAFKNILSEVKDEN